MGGNKRLGEKSKINEIECSRCKTMFNIGYTKRYIVKTHLSVAHKDGEN
jgi:hypothetical protein